MRLLIANSIYIIDDVRLYITFERHLEPVTGQRSMGIWNLVRRKSMRGTPCENTCSTGNSYGNNCSKSVFLFLSSLSFLDCQPLYAFKTFLKALSSFQQKFDFFFPSFFFFKNIAISFPCGNLPK